MSGVPVTMEMFKKVGTSAKEQVSADPCKVACVQARASNQRRFAVLAQATSAAIRGAYATDASLSLTVCGDIPQVHVAVCLCNCELGGAFAFPQRGARRERIWPQVGRPGITYSCKRAGH